MPTLLVMAVILPVLKQLAQIAATHQFPCRVHFGPIASGDEDVVDAARSAEVFAAAQALCVAWEGGGGARAARFSGVGFIEIRAITMRPTKTPRSRSMGNLAKVLSNVSDLLAAWRAGTQAGFTEAAATV
jgi:adenosylhomocysteine nucleosidase